MKPLALISEFSDRGIAVNVIGADLNLNAPKGALTPKLVDRLRENKQDVILWLGRLRNELGEDWKEFSSDPEQLKAAAESLMTIIMRKRGIVPDHYTVAVHCQNCNQDVPHFSVDGDTVGACVWCLDGLTTPAIPSL